MSRSSDELIFGKAEPLATYRRLNSKTVASSFQFQQRDPFGGQMYRRSNLAIADIGTLLGYNALASGNRSVAVGAFSYAKEDQSVAVGVYAQAGANSGVAIGPQANVQHAFSMGFGYLATSSTTNQCVFGSPSGPLVDTVIYGGPHGQATRLKHIVEPGAGLTITTAASTDSTIQIPAGAIVLGVSVRVHTAIPTAATFTVTGATSGTTFSTAAVSTAVNSTDPGTAAGAYYNATAQLVRITPNAAPGTATGVVAITIHCIILTPPTV